MTGDDHEPERDPLIEKIFEALIARMNRDDDEIEQIEKEAEDAKKKLEDGNKWPDQ
jgi:hypothetical protein